MDRTFENVSIDRAGTDGRVALLTLNRPEKMNALSQELLFELSDALHDLEADDSARVIIVRGAGRTFSAGYDLAPARGGADAVVRRYRGADDKGRRLLMGTRTGMQQITDIHMYFWNMAKVTIAMVHGYALAGGCELAMMADLVTAAEDAQFGHPGLRGLGTSRTGVIWPLVIGMRKAKELLYTGDSVSGTEAERIGMVNRAVPADKLDAEVERWAERIALQAPDSLALQKRSVNTYFEAMGIYQALHSATDTDAMYQFSGQAYLWQDKIRELGMREAVSWRDGEYRDAPQIH